MVGRVSDDNSATTHVYFQSCTGEGQLRVQEKEARLNSLYTIRGDSGATCRRDQTVTL